MAAKRITRSSIDWLAFAQKVPENQKMLFQAFKAKSDKYLNKALSLPENPPKIDWNAYRTKVANVALVDKFEKEYNAFTVPYPKENVISQIDAQEREAGIEAEAFIKQSNENIAKHKLELERWINMIPIQHMTLEDFRDAFPEEAFDPLNKPTFWPHNDVEDEEEGLEAHKGH